MFSDFSYAQLWRQEREIISRIVLTIVAIIALLILQFSGWVNFLLYLLVYLLIGYDILRDAIRNILNRQLFDENFLMAIATVGAFALAIYDQSEDYLEAIAVMLFYQIGEFFQDLAVDQSRKSISSLLDIRPDYANIAQGEKLHQVDPEEVAIGTVIVIQPGERVPLDGVIVSGSSTLNTAVLSGESVPRDVTIGDEVYSGSINLTGVLEVRTTREFAESTVAKILELVENSSSHKARAESFISKFARVYTPIVCYSALALAVIPPLVLQIWTGTSTWETWLYRALIFLVISCPCALVVSVPLSFFAGLGGASRVGILIKGSNYIETLARAGCVVFDKTGTLTQGKFTVSEIRYNAIAESQLLELAAHVEHASSHPIAQSVVEAYQALGQEIERSRVTETTEVAGQGITARVDGTLYAVGNVKLMHALQVTIPEDKVVGTVLHVAREQAYLGMLVVTDQVKDSSPLALQELAALEIRNTVMLTGDVASVAQQVAKQLGIVQVQSDLLPGAKVQAMETLLANKAPQTSVLFVGDGINDAPVLTRADVGIAMGVLGSDAAIEAADVVLMHDNLQQIPQAIALARHVLRIVNQNIYFALGVKFGCLLLGALGIANLWLAIFADVGVAVLCVLNAMRAFQVPSLK